MNYADLIARLHKLDEMGYKSLTGPIGKEAADALATLTSGDVSLPEPSGTVFNSDKPRAYSDDEMQDYGDRRAAAAVLAERERCAKVAGLYVIEKREIHPDIPFDLMTDDAQRICHVTCQYVADAIRAIK